MHFKRHFFFYTISGLLLLLAAASYYRFMVTLDYVVAYEGNCDPYTQSCYLYCEDDACTEPVYSSYMVRNANTLVALCGDDITECDEAYYCQKGEDSCSITFCDPKIEGGDVCATLTETDRQRQGVPSKETQTISPDPDLVDKTNRNENI